jgi:hypothetical protein
MIDDIGRDKDFMDTVLADYPPSCNVYGHLCERVCIKSLSINRLYSNGMKYCFAMIFLYHHTIYNM